MKSENEIFKIFKNEKLNAVIVGTIKGGFKKEDERNEIFSIKQAISEGLFSYVSYNLNIISYLNLDDIAEDVADVVFSVGSNLVGDTFKYSVENQKLYSKPKENVGSKIRLVTNYRY